MVLFAINPRDVGLRHVDRLSIPEPIPESEVEALLKRPYYSCMTRDYLLVLQLLIKNRFGFDIEVPDADQNINPPLRRGSRVILPVIKIKQDVYDMGYTAQELRKAEVEGFVVSIVR